MTLSQGWGKEGQGELPRLLWEMTQCMPCPGGTVCYVPTCHGNPDTALCPCGTSGTG